MGAEGSGSSDQSRVVFFGAVAQPKVALFPAAKLCVTKAIKFVPKLEAVLNAAKAKSAGPALDFGSDDDSNDDE